MRYYFAPIQNSTTYENLSQTHPKIAAEWDYEKNSPLTPDNVSKGQKREVWWRCKNGHSYPARIDHRCSMKSGCPFCAPNGLVIKGENDLLTLFPEIAGEWDYTQNELRPDEYRPYSNKSVYWICPICGNSYAHKIHNRTLNGFGCPQCMKESHTSFQEQTINYYLSQVTNVENRANVHGFELDIFLTDLGIGIEYNGEYFHQNKQMSDSRKLHQLSQAGVRVIVIDCGRFREKDGDHLTLETKKMGNPSENELNWCLNEIFTLLELPIPDINLHRDRVTIYKQYISAIKANSLAEKYPSIAQEWDCDQNHGLSPAAFSYGSQKTVWWKCPTCHLSYDMKIYNRTSGKQNCPYCSGKRIAEGYNDLATTHPKLVKEWDFLANEYPPQRYTHGSNYKAAWVCQDCGYHWRSAIYSRVQGKGCPACAERNRGNRRKKSIQTERKYYTYPHNELTQDT